MHNPAMSNHLQEQATLQTLETHRERVRKALDEYIRELHGATSPAYMSETERRSADVSRIQAESAQRVLWMD